MGETREEMIGRLAECQRDVAEDVDTIVLEMQTYTACLLPAIGEITPNELLERLQGVTMRAFQRRMERRL